jgi:hypothetical protein
MEFRIELHAADDTFNKNLKYFGKKMFSFLI